MKLRWILGLGLLGWCGCGNEAVSGVGFGGNTAPPVVAEAAAPELGEAGAAAPEPGEAGEAVAGSGAFAFDFRGSSSPATLSSALGTAVESVGLNTPGKPARFFFSLVNNQTPGLVDRRLVVQVGVPSGPLLLTGTPYPVGAATTRVNYLERSSAVAARIYDGVSGSLTLLALQPDHVDVRLENVRLVLRGNPGQTLDLQGTGSFDF